MSRDNVKAVEPDAETPETLPKKRFNLNRPLLVKLGVAAAGGAALALTIREKFSGRSEGQGSEDGSAGDQTSSD